MIASRHTHGFTLVELLVVVAIITALIAILLPSMGRAIAVAEKAACMSGMRQIGVAFRGYQVDHRGVSHAAPNHGRWKGVAGDPLADTQAPWLSANDPTAYWGVAYGPYVDWKIEVFRCPTAGDVDDWWENDQPRYRYSSFGLNLNVSNATLASVSNHSERIMFQDAAEQLMDDNGDNWSIPPGDWINMSQWRLTWVGSWPNGWREYFRHFEYGNGLFYDLHAGDQPMTTGEDVPRRWYTSAQ